ncbi:DUF3194 domain-containing protein [Halosimplex halophilum]|uniref:DUF3194 domain-containing protein n=1 Tax=Halosimplex halophilum TaxID=2559572 RepID=UPI00107F95A2|nr:DUF3194 domain-containing protein [Halosimplex halophilum]
MPTDDAAADGDADPTDEEVVQTAAEAAETVVFSRFDRSAVDDLDVTVTFEDGVLEVDVYLNAPDAAGDPDRVADDAALAARGAVDDLFA